jgi:hypothetical protein
MKLCVRASLSLAMIALAWGLAVPAHATVMVEIPMEQLIADADVIAHGTVVRAGTRLEQFDGRFEPHAIAELHVTEWLKGQTDDRLEIDEIGGDTETYGTWIEGTPRYGRGDEVIVFLRRLPNGSFRTVGMAQGRFDVVHTISATPGGTTTVRRDMRALGFASWATGEMVVEDGALGPSIGYDEFVGFVRGVVEQLTVPAETSSVGGAR